MSSRYEEDRAHARWQAARDRLDKLAFGTAPASELRREIRKTLEAGGGRYSNITKRAGWKLMDACRALAKAENRTVRVRGGGHVIEASPSGPVSVRVLDARAEKRHYGSVVPMR